LIVVAGASEPEQRKQEGGPNCKERCRQERCRRLGGGRRLARWACPARGLKATGDVWAELRAGNCLARAAECDVRN